MVGKENKIQIIIGTSDVKIRGFFFSALLQAASCKLQNLNFNNNNYKE
jgi:hypothetical protein